MTEKYIHDENGNVYEIVCIANQGATRPGSVNIKERKPGYPVTVVYKDAKGHIWAQREDHFIAKFTRVSRHPDKQFRSPNVIGVISP